MKILVNNYDKEIKFEDLEEAKVYYTSKDSYLGTEDEYLGKDWEGYCEEFAEYRSKILAAESLEELAEVLNKYTDTFDNGSMWSVREF